MQKLSLPVVSSALSELRIAAPLPSEHGELLLADWQGVVYDVPLHVLCARRHGQRPFVVENFGEI